MKRITLRCVRPGCRSEVLSERNIMTNKIDLRTLLSKTDRTLEQKLALFAWLNLGLVESLTCGLMTATDAVRIFFNAENSLFVREDLAEQNAHAIMTLGVQLADLFDALPAEEAQQEFQR